MGYYLVELDAPELEGLARLVREAIEAADENEVSELEALLSALGNVRWQACSSPSRLARTSGVKKLMPVVGPRRIRFR